MSDSHIKLDLSQFKHMKSDEHGTTLEHPDGHCITLSHKALSPESHEQLKALMAEGGKVVEAGDVDKAPATGEPKRPPSKRDIGESASGGKARGPVKSVGEALDRLNPFKAEGGYVQKMATGGPPGAPAYLQAQDPNPTDDVVDQEFFKSEQAGAQAAGAKPPVNVEQVETQKLYNNIIKGQKQQPVINSILGAVGGPAVQAAASYMTPSPGPYAEFGPNGEPPQSFDAQAWNQAEGQLNQQKLDSSNESAAKAQKLTADNEVRMRAGLPPIPVPGVNTPNGLPAGVQQEVQAGAMPQQGSMDQGISQKPPQAAGQNFDPESMFKHGYGQQQAGIQQEAQAVGQLGQQQAQMLDNQAKAQQTAMDTYKSSYDALEAERKAHIEDIQAGHIDPNKYWDNHSKVAAGIGMILAGFNPTNSPNAAIKFLEHQMDQNLNAQMKNMDSKQNLLRANLQQFGNLKDAMTMTQIMQKDMVAAQLGAAAAKAQSPMAKAAALKAGGQLEQSSAQMAQQFAMRRAMMGLAQQGNNPQAMDQMLQYMRVMNPEMAKEMEGRYIPGIGMASVPLTPEVRGKITGMQELNVGANDLINFVKTHTTLNPLSKDYAIGQQKALALQSMVREGKLGTVYREGEQPLLDKFVNSNPAGAMKLLQTLPKLQELLHSNGMQLNVLKKSYGLPSEQQAPEPQVATMKGVKYQKVNGGWQRLK